MSAAAAECCRTANPFQLCSGLRSAGSVMILIFAAIAAATYYSVVVLAWGPRLLRGGIDSVAAAAVLVVFHLVGFMLLWSYFMVVTQDPGTVPKNWRPICDEESLDVASSVALSTDFSSDVRPTAMHSSAHESSTTSVMYCSQCKNGKPPRSHHCSVCQRCVLKMDHHCIWVVNCVGARNYKFFLLFLLYAFLETILDTLSLLPLFFKLFGETAKPSKSPADLAVTLLAFVINLTLAASLVCFVVMHISLLFRNTTTIELQQKKKAAMWRYDLGWRRNIQQVFGTKKKLWLLPLFAPEDIACIPALQGIEFPTRSDIVD